jgi:guanylate kinase
MENTKRIIVIEGPSGTGKDTIIKKLIEKFPDKYEKITSYTTREKRDGEIDGQVYNFIDRQTFKDKFENGEIFEFTKRHGSYRGMSKSLINKIIDNGKIALKDVDNIGMRAIKSVYEGQVLTIFITAKKEIIRERLTGRGGAIEDIEQRLHDYDLIHNYVDEYDHIITNNGTVDACIKKILKILKDN